MKKTKRCKTWAVKSQKTIGKHLIVDFWFGKKIEDPKKLGRVLIKAAKKAGNTPLEFSYHKFNPQGITGVLLLAESHIAFHSWPEFNFLAIDIFTCGKKAFPEKALKYLKRIFKPKRVKIWKLNRGTKWK
jgi:S-adenosylmethionine decarboxylase